MSFAIAVRTNSLNWGLMLFIPQYRPSILLAVIAALFLTVASLGADVALGWPVGTVSLLPAALSLGVTLGALVLEVRKNESTKR